MNRKTNVIAAAAFVVSFGFALPASSHEQEEIEQELGMSQEIATAELYHNCLACCVSSTPRVKLHYDLNEDTCAQLCLVLQEGAMEYLRAVPDGIGVLLDLHDLLTRDR